MSADGAPPPAGAPYAGADGLDVALDGHVLRLTLNRPEARNACNAGMMLAAIAALDRAAEDEAVRAVLLASAGDHFCGGGDIVSRNAPGGPKPRVGSIQRRVPVQAHRLIQTLLTVQVPVVARVRGWAAGLGFQLALAADFCVAADDARFWEPFLSRGFTPDSGATWLLPRMVGLARARDVLVLGRELSGAEAAAWGVVHRSVPDAELDTAAEDLVQELAAGPTVAVGLTKWLINQGAQVDLEQQLRNEAFGLELSSRSLDFREGLAAFQEKRSPDFQGR